MIFSGEDAVVLKSLSVTLVVSGVSGASGPLEYRPSARGSGAAGEREGSGRECPRVPPAATADGVSDQREAPLSAA